MPFNLFFIFFFSPYERNGFEGQTNVIMLNCEGPNIDRHSIVYCIAYITCMQMYILASSLDAAACVD